MSPEQLRGLPADHRTDLFSFGAVLYEMLSGKRAFRGETAADTVSAILREEPPDLSATNRTIPPALERVVRHCLEKSPDERAHSAHDLAFDLESLLDGVLGPLAARPCRASRSAAPAAGRSWPPRRASARAPSPGTPFGRRPRLHSRRSTGSRSGAETC